MWLNSGEQIIGIIGLELKCRYIILKCCSKRVGMYIISSPLKHAQLFVNLSVITALYLHSGIPYIHTHTSIFSAMIEEDDVAVIPSQPITCSENFYLVEAGNVTYCAPQCPSWKQHPTYISLLVDYMVLVCACVGVLSAIGVLGISFCRRHYM